MAPVVFAGYGITDNENHYDDYAGIDVKDKIVLILRHEPQENDATSFPSARRLSPTRPSNAKMHGAQGVILVNDVYRITRRGRRAREVRPGRPGPPTRAFFRAGEGKPPPKAGSKPKAAICARSLEGIDKDLKPHSFALTKLTVDVDVDIQHETKTVHNVAAYLPGEDRRVRGHRRALRSPGPGRRAFAGAVADRHDSSRRGRQRFGHRRRDRTGALVLEAAETEARDSVPDLRGRGTGTARQRAGT